MDRQYRIDRMDAAGGSLAGLPTRPAPDLPEARFQAQDSERGDD